MCNRDVLIRCLFLSLVTRMWMLPATAIAQVLPDTLRFRVMSYNVENLFDCRHDTLKEDEEFLPDAIRHWTPARYRKKVDDVARVIVACGGWDLPALVGLCEVENDAVMRQLTRYSALREAGYRYVMTDSPDRRGIDVALLYQRHLFKLLGSRSIRLHDALRQGYPSRDILHVTGQLLNGDTLDVFVCHFPSRSGGVHETEPRRLLAARSLAGAVDSLLSVRRRPQVLVMGDMNDYPGNASLRLLQEEGRLHHLLAGKARTRRGYGSYKYQGQWGLLDHLLVSSSLLSASSPLLAVDADVLSLPFLLSDDRKYGGSQPFRTYYGMKYQGGYSDHLPVWVEFRLCY